MGRLDGKFAIVTGSTGGIGAAIAHKFAAEGAAGVMIVGRNEDQAKAVATTIGKAGGKAMPCRANISDPGDVERMVALAIAEWGGINILVNNAAYTNPERDLPVINADLDDWNKAFSVNVTGPMLCCKYVLPHMIAHGGGAIVNSGSVAGSLAEGSVPAYCCSKAALVRLSQHLAVAYAEHRVRSNLVTIGGIETEASKSAVPQVVREIMSKNHLVGRMGSTEEIANVVAFLASDEASFITGADIAADGGLMAHLPHMVQLNDYLRSQDSGG